MLVKDLVFALHKCNPYDTIKLIQEEELECMPEWWDDGLGVVSDNVTVLCSEDLYSHEMYLLAIKN